MTLEDLITEFRGRATDTVAPYLFSDDEITRWINEAESEAAIRARLIVDTTEIDVSAGDPVCDLPEKLFDIRYAELRNTGGERFEVIASSRQGLDAARPGWRTRAARPCEYVHDDKALMLGAVPDADYTLALEFFREPAYPLTNDTDEPEIHARHHVHLVEWALHKAYSKPDAETQNPGEAVKAEQTFTQYFGRRPNADTRRRQNASRPHRNKLHQ